MREKEAQYTIVASASGEKQAGLHGTGEYHLRDH